LHHLFRRRVDLRNHRKIVVIDNQITYCGSQNCADPEFLIKAKFAPWVDIMVRFTGPVALQNQRIFIADWMAHIDEDLAALLEEPLAPTTPGITAQAIGTGPTLGYSAMPEIFEMLIFTARTSLTISFPARNDSWVVGAASRSYYAALLGAGVEIFEYHPGLLHAKTLTIDGDLTLVGSANLDRRSFDLNYENNLLVYDPTLTRQIRERQQSYINDSTPITTEFVAQWSIARRLLNNSIAILGPIL
ncbi:MAG: phospholipase D-like domain-containing protein, partial [Verrucomicrobia bacterium]|nr:phospholipase D-like domain-containing protein [Verrucomicrobiota bacterium]